MNKGRHMGLRPGRRQRQRAYRKSLRKGSHKRLLIVEVETLSEHLWREEQELMQSRRSKYERRTKT